MMKKTAKVWAYGLMAAMLLAGCSGETQDESAAAGSSAEAVTDASGTTVVLGTYKGVTYTPMSTEITDEQVEAEMQALVDANPVISEVDRAAEDGDIVNIDYVGMKDGEPFDGGSDDGFDLTLGSNRFIDGFEEGLIGAVKGQELSLNLTFPEDYGSEELAGQAVVFDVTVNAVKESVPAVLDDDFVKEYTDYETVDAYREATRENLESYAEASALVDMQNQVFSKVMDEAQVTVTDEAVQDYYDDQMAGYQTQAETLGIDLETMVSFYGMDMETFEEQLREMSEEATRQNAVIRAIADAEGMTVSDEDMEQTASDLGYEDVDAMLETAGQDVVDNYILAQKVINFLTDNAVAE